MPDEEHYDVEKTNKHLAKLGVITFDAMAILSIICIFSFKMPKAQISGFLLFMTPLLLLPYFYGNIVGKIYAVTFFLLTLAFFFFVK